MILDKPSSDFNPVLTVGCLCQRNGKFLLLHRASHKKQGNTYGAPGGKVENGEELTDALVREIFEETKLIVNKESLQYLGSVNIRLSYGDFIYHLYRTNIADTDEITLNEQEHQGYIWVTKQESLQLPLMENMSDCIELFY